jgi:hypothetical protein
VAAALCAACLGSVLAPRPACAQEEPRAPTATAGLLRFPGIAIDPAGRRIEVDATFEIVEAVVRLEYLAVTEQGKAYESLFSLGTTAENLQLGLIAIGLEPRPEIQYQGEARDLSGPRVAIEAEWEAGGERRRARVEDLLFDVRLGRPMERTGFAFTGSRFVTNRTVRRRDRPGGEAGPPREVLAAAASGSLVALYHDPDAILDNPLYTGGDAPICLPTFGMIEVATWIRGNDRLQPAAERVPPRGTRAKLVITPLGSEK